MSYQEIIIESGYSCDWQQKCSQFEDTLKSKKHPVLVFSQNEKTMISGDFPSKKTLEKFYFYFFRFMNLLKKSSSYGVVIQRNIEDFEIPVVIQSNSVLCENLSLTFGVTNERSRIVKIVSRNMGVFSSFSKTVLSDLVNVQEFSIFDLLKKFSRIKKLFLFKRSSFEKKVSSSKVEVVPLGEIDAKKLEDLDKFIFFESQDLHSIDVKATFNYIFKSYKNNMNQYYSLCSYFLAALSLNHVVLKKTAVLDIKKQSNRRVITVVLDGEPSTIDMVVFLLRLNFSVALEHDDKVLKLEALKSLKKKINISFKGNHPDKIWSNQVYWPERTVRFLPKAVSIHRGLYELVFDASKTRFAYHCTMYGDFLEVSDPSSIFTGHHAVYHNRFFSKHNISIVNFLKKAVLDFLFCYSLEFKVFFPKIVEALKNQKIIAFDTIDKCQNILADTNLINLGSKNKKFNNWNEFQRVNKSIAQLNYIENRDHFIQSLVFYLFGLMKELTRDYELSTYDMYIYLRAATLTDNSFLERFFVESLDDSQSAKLDFSFNQSKKMIKEVYDRL